MINFKREEVKLSHNVQGGAGGLLLPSGSVTLGKTLDLTGFLFPLLTPLPVKDPFSLVYFMHPPPMTLVVILCTQRQMFPVSDPFKWLCFSE